MRFFKIIPVAFALLGLCKYGQAGVLENDVVAVTDDNIVSSTNDTFSFEKRAKSIDEIKKKVVDCGHNTKICNIGFDKIIAEMYGFRWEIHSPKPFEGETFRTAKKDSDEYVSVIATIHNYNAFFPVHIYGRMYDGGCINDTDNKCSLSEFITHKASDKKFADFTIRNIEEKEYKLVRFKYSSFWKGNCFETWNLRFDIKATKSDLRNWAYYNSINLNDFD